VPCRIRHYDDIFLLSKCFEHQVSDCKVSVLQFVFKYPILRGNQREILYNAIKSFNLLHRYSMPEEAFDLFLYWALYINSKHGIAAGLVTVEVTVISYIFTTSCPLRLPHE